MLILILLAFITGDEIDRLREIKPTERCAYYNKMADRARGENARPHYARAKELRNLIETYTPGEDQTERTARQRHVGDNQLALALADRWSAEERDTIEDWLKRNDGCLEELKIAAELRRDFNKLDVTKRYSAAVLDDLLATRRWFAKLLAVRANASALRGEWIAAWNWNLRIHTLADHAWQQGTSIGNLVGASVEAIACDQALAFLRRRPKPPAELIAKTQAGDDMRCPLELSAKFELLFVIDTLERHFAWANGAADPDVDEQVKSFTNGDMAEMGAVIRSADGSAAAPPESFASVESYRTALRGISIDDELDILRAQDGIMAAWMTGPLPEAWGEVEKLSRELGDAVRDSKFNRLFSIFGRPAARTRQLLEQSRLRRVALSAVVAVLQFRAKHDKLPSSLDDLKLDPPPIDSFSGKPLKYELIEDGKDFRLYSVGPDLKDDGGRHNDKWIPDGDYVFWPPVIPAIEQQK